MCFRNTTWGHLISELTTCNWLLSHFRGSHFSSLAKWRKTSFVSWWCTTSSTCDNHLPSAGPHRCSCYLQFCSMLSGSCGLLAPLLDETHLALVTWQVPFLLPTASSILPLLLVNTHSLPGASLATADHIALWDSGITHVCNLQRLT